MERAVMKPKKPHTVTKNHIGCYHAPSKSYSRRKCLSTMVAMDPELRLIYVRLNNQNFEVAKRSGRLLAKGRLVFHFNAHWKTRVGGDSHARSSSLAAEGEASR